jgi:hypothetical protein
MITRRRIRARVYGLRLIPYSDRVHLIGTGGRAVMSPPHPDRVHEVIL